VDRPPDTGRSGITLRTTVGLVLGVLGVICAALGLFLINGVSIEFPGIILGGLGYYFCLQSGGQGGSRGGQILGIVAVVLCVISIGVSGLSDPPQ
jgi:hypothetical protein